MEIGRWDPSKSAQEQSENGSGKDVWFFVEPLSLIAASSCRVNDASVAIQDEVRESSRYLEPCKLEAKRARRETSTTKSEV